MGCKSEEYCGYLIMIKGEGGGGVWEDPRGKQANLTAVDSCHKKGGWEVAIDEPW